MTTITVSPSTHAKLVNDKTVELRSIEKVILNLYDRAEGINPVATPTPMKIDQQEEEKSTPGKIDKVNEMEKNWDEQQKEKKVY